MPEPHSNNGVKTPTLNQKLRVLAKTSKKSSNSPFRGGEAAKNGGNGPLKFATLSAGLVSGWVPTTPLRMLQRPMRKGGSTSKKCSLWPLLRRPAPALRKQHHLLFCRRLSVGHNAQQPAVSSEEDSDCVYSQSLLHSVLDVETCASNNIHSAVI
ncbi:hypothetical protein M0R45_000905 [Rubus argutus]|uniref:Uncharacterized protein n=1 Tax=Rubus argutus TaxID=59490 RepID=A0AAW1VMZ3_RUBAR